MQYAQYPFNPNQDVQTNNISNNNINEIENCGHEHLASSLYLNEDEIKALEAKTASQKTIVDSIISQQTPNINQSTILGLDNMKSISQSMMKNDTGVSKISFNNQKGDFLEVQEKTKVTSNDMQKLKQKYISNKYDLKQKILNEVKVNITFQSTVGLISSLEHVLELSIGKNEEKIKKKYEIYKDVFSRWRKVKGDGNCFYRAVMFRYIELIILNNDIPSMESLIWNYEKSIKEKEIQERIHITNNIKILLEANVEILLVIYNAMKANDVITAYKLFVKALLSSNSFDYGLILYYRYMLMQYIKRNENKLYLKDFAIKIGNLLPIEYETENGDFLFNDFYKNYLMKIFKDAEKIIVYLTPFVLKTKLKVVLFDEVENSKDCLKEITYGTEISDKEDYIMVVNRTNHYDLVYTEKDYQKKINILKHYTFNPPYEPKILRKNNNTIKAVTSKNNIVDINNISQVFQLQQNNTTVKKENIVNQKKNNEYQINELKKSIATKKEKEIMYCSRCKAICSPNPKNYYFLLCYNCLLSELRDGFLLNYFRYISPQKHILNYDLFLQISNTIKNSLITIQDQQLSLGYLLVILNADSNKKYELNIFSLFEELKLKICKNCDNLIKSPPIILPCGCSICSTQCFYQYFTSILNNNSFYCICNSTYGPYQLLKLYALMIHFQIGTNLFDNIINRYRYLVNTHCASCKKNLKNYMFTKIHYDVAFDVEKFNQVYSLIKNRKPEHNLCIDCYTRSNKENKFFCDFCHVEHFNIQISHSNDDCLII